MSDTLHEATAEIERRLAMTTPICVRPPEPVERDRTLRSNEHFRRALLVAAALAAAGCGDTINPVRYQPVTQVITRPCFAGRTPPAEAVELTQPVCSKSPPECVTEAKADIQELQREAKQYRKLFQECSK